MKSAYGCRTNSASVGVLLAQLGTPEAPTKAALRPYLKQFLSDRRVIEVNPVLWWGILNGIILNTRPKRSAKLYSRIWTDKGSPLFVTTQMQAQKCKERLEGQGIHYEFAVGMRYGQPSLESAVDELIAKGCSRILLFPMYPQYSASTTASTYDAVFPHLLKRRVVPTLKVVDAYYNRKSFINSLVARMNEFYSAATPRPERLILSYHGVPISYVDKGDTYCCQCVETTQLFIKASGMNANEVIHTFQSRFGKEPWLNPYTDVTIEKLAQEGIKHLAVMCPGFTADCLETLDEIGNEARELFQEHGGDTLRLIPCVNDHPVWIEAMAKIILEETTSWRSDDSLPGCYAACPVDRE